MRLSFISCSGANEHTNIRELADTFGNLFDPEIVMGIQVSGMKASFNTPRYLWLESLYKYLEKTNTYLNISLHINQDWAERFLNGDVPEEVHHFLTTNYKRGIPFIKAVQLNFKLSDKIEKDIDADVLVKTMQRYPRQDFILSCNKRNNRFITRIYNESSYKFLCLYDESFGEGIIPDQREAPLFEDRLQGYAGGLSPDNIIEELQKIEKLVDSDTEIFVDAEGKLKDANGKFSIAKAKEFADNCWKYNWNNFRL